MITDQQYRRLKKYMKKREKLEIASAQAGMSENTARKYLCLHKLPSQLKKEHTWQTRKDPFEEEWTEIKKC